MTNLKNQGSLCLLFLTAFTFLVSCGKKENFLSMTEPRRVEILVLGHESELRKADDVSGNSAFPKGNQSHLHHRS
jgi:hypothetical protein